MKIFGRRKKTRITALLLLSVVVALINAPSGIGVSKKQSTSFAETGKNTCEIIQPHGIYRVNLCPKTALFPPVQFYAKIHPANHDFASPFCVHSFRYFNRYCAYSRSVFS